MSYTALIHIQNEEAVIGEIEELPAPTDQSIRVQNPRKRDGKDLPFLQSDVTTVIWPMIRIAFIEILHSGTEDEIIGFVRE
jgi:hypothetical protein